MRWDARPPSRGPCPQRMRAISHPSLVRSPAGRQMRLHPSVCADRLPRASSSHNPSQLLRASDNPIPRFCDDSVRRRPADSGPLSRAGGTHTTGHRFEDGAPLLRCHPWPTSDPPTLARSLQTGEDPLARQLALEFSHDAEHAQHHATPRGASVGRQVQDPQRDARITQLVDALEHISEAAAEPDEFRDDERVPTRSASRLRAARSSTAHAVAGVGPRAADRPVARPPGRRDLVARC